MTLIILPFAVITAFSMENISSINDAQLSLFDKLTPFSRVSGYFSLKFSSRIFKVFLFLVFIFALVILNRLQIMKVYNMDSAVLLKFIYGCLVFLLIFGFNIVLFFFREKGSITTNFYSIVLVFFMFFESFYFMSGINPVVESKIYDTASLSIPAVPMIKSNNYKIMHTDAADRDRVIPGSSVFDSDRNFLMQIPSNTGMLFDISEAGGYDALELKDYHDFMSGIFKGDEILSLEKLNLLNVKYLVTLADMRMEDLDKLYDGPYFKIYKNHSALPMFFASKSKDTLDLLISQSSWSRKLYDFSLCRVSATIDEDGYFIFSNNFYPGWKVYVDNKTAELEKCFGIYMGVKLTKGTHDLIFKYHPNNMGLYMFLFYVIVLAFLVSGVVYLFYRK